MDLFQRVQPMTMHPSPAMHIPRHLLVIACFALWFHPASAQKPKPASGDANQPVPAKDDGSDFLRDLRRRTQPVLESMTKEHGYRLEPGEQVRRVAPPFAPIRMDYYRIGHPTQAEHIPRGPSAMVFHWEEGRSKNGGMTFGTDSDAGYTLESLMDIVFDLKSQSIQASKSLRRRRVAGDWVVERGKAFNAEKARAQLERILQQELGPKVTLTLRDVMTDVYVARGVYMHSAGDPSQAKKGKIFLTDETFDTDQIDIYGKARYAGGGGAGGGTGDVNEFFDWLGRWIESPVINEVETPPANLLSWALHGGGPHHDDHSPDLVLPNITFQTGLTFRKERRPVRMALIEESK
jgi:hypothetical protein